jgi:DNA-binding CsgD family transcriptional regulator/tetratricopeptide (TPR) repeat protein
VPDRFPTVASAGGWCQSAAVVVGITQAGSDSLSERALLEREVQLVRLRQLLADARRERGRLVLLAGEAGIGKTSLAAAFCHESVASARVFWGACDPIVPARPFAPIVDIALAAGGRLRRAVEASDRDAIFAAFLGLLRATRLRPTVVVLDDVHWADEATLELLLVVGRRLATLPVLLIATFRDHQVPVGHPLRLALAELPAATTEELKLRPLSLAAVRTLAAGSGRDAEELHAATAGNPFFVTESLAAGAVDLPASVRDAVLARAAGLSRPARDLLSAASVLGQRFDIELALTMAEADQEAVDECLARGLLQLHGGEGFRHELARRALRDGLNAAQVSELHRRAFLTLSRNDPAAEPAALALHAQGWGNRDAVLGSAPEAARRAAELGAHREAATHYAALLRLVPDLDARSRAQYLEAHAREALRTDDTAAALASQREALECWRRLGDRLREGDCLSRLSTAMYFSGEGDRARETAAAAVDLLESLPAGRELAMAYASLAQRIVVSGQDDAEGIRRSEQALALAERVGDDEVYVHALTTIGVARVYQGDPRGWATLEEAARRAQAAGLFEAAGRAFINLVECCIDFKMFRRADEYVEEAMAALADHDFDVFRRVLEIRLAELDFERGRWSEAEESADSLAARPKTANRILVRALTLLGRLQARRGKGDAWKALDRALALVDARELQELCPLRAARAEAALIGGDRARASHEAGIALELARIPPSGGEGNWWWAEAAFLAWRTGAIEQLPDEAPRPYALHAAGCWRQAAEAWHQLGCTYEAALALADSDDEADLREALDEFLGLGAQPMASAVAGELRRRGASRIARGPRPSTRAHAARLTARESEVLALVAQGLTNAEIARRLVLSVRTVDRHVSSALHKLGAPSRQAAVGKLSSPSRQVG